MSCYRLLCVVFLINILFHSTMGEGTYVLKAAKNVPRIGRSPPKNNKNIDQMGEFFMKASKSVPRIGRRNNENYDYDSWDYPTVNKRDQLSLWSDLADRFEYEPEIFASPEILERLEMGDDPSAYDWDKKRDKRNLPSGKHHPKFYYLQ